MRIAGRDEVDEFRIGCSTLELAPAAHRHAGAEHQDLDFNHQLRLAIDDRLAAGLLIAKR